MDFKDYYQILGLPATASDEEIKSTYKRLARKYHPDVSKEANATEKFQEVSEAYEVLRKKDKRAEYDELREYVQNPGKFRQSGGEHFDFGEGFSANGQFEDLIRSIFGQAGPAGARGFGGADGFGGRQFSTKGRDLRHKLSISLSEAYEGSSRKLRLNTASGEKTINVKIPKGVADGKELRLKGLGEPGSGGAAAGDLYLELNFEKHPLFTVEGNDIMLVLPVAPWTAALGDSVEVQTLKGPVTLKVPANSKNGHKLRLKGRGLAGGDQYVVLKIENPAITTDADRAAYQALRDHYVPTQSA